jgi:hypothetical protein
MTYADGRVYVGNWEDGNMHGGIVLVLKQKAVPCTTYTKEKTAVELG